MGHYGSFPSPCSDRTPPPNAAPLPLLQRHQPLLPSAPSFPFSPCSSSGVAGGSRREPSSDLAQTRCLSTATPCKYPQRALPRQHFQPWFDPPRTGDSASLCSSMVNLNFSSEEASQKSSNLFSDRTMKAAFGWSLLERWDCVSGMKGE